MSYKYYLFTAPVGLAIGIFFYYYYNKSPQWFLPFIVGCIFALYISFLHRKYSKV